MKPPLIHQGEGPAGINRIHHHHQETQAALNRMLNTAHNENELQRRHRGLIAKRSPAGDEQRLRGIPCIAHGVTGAIPGTRPGA